MTMQYTNRVLITFLVLLISTLSAQTISPIQVTLGPSQSQQFAVSNAGAGSLVWTISPTAAGRIQYGLYTAPSLISAATNVTVTARNTSGTILNALITLQPPVTVSVLPAWITLSNGQSANFTGGVTGSTNTALTWTASYGTITSSGVYTVPVNLTTSQNATITARSVADPTKSATATIALVPTVAVVLAPALTSLTGGQNTALNGIVYGTANNAIVWSMSPQTGTLSNGVYTAPNPVPSAGTVTITATSQAYPTKSASTVISLVPITVSVSPTSGSLSGGQKITLTPKVTGSSNTALSWTLSPAVGSVNAGVYTAPSSITSSQKVTVTATSSADATKSASAIISLTASSVSTSISPTSASLNGGNSATFKATVSGSSNTSVTWKMSPSVGTLSGGVYTAPATVSSSQTVTVTATSAADTTKSASATVTLVPVSVSVSPGSASLSAGQSKTFQASVSGSSNTGVTWSMSPSVGTLSGGVYTAPSSVSSAQTITITATSSADSTKKATATVSLAASPTVSVSVSPTTASLSAGQSVTVTPTVSGSSNTSVNWSLSPQVGSVSSGVYTAPSQVLLQQSVTVTATSAADPTKTASAVVTLIPTLSIVVSPTSASLSGGQTVQLSASLSGTTNPNVTWSLSPSVGSLSNGLYQAPSTVTSQQTVKVTATAAADSTKSASATITLMPPTNVGVSPSTVSLGAGQSAQFSATVGGVSSTAVSWTLSPSVGTVTNGNYTAPSSITSNQTVTLTAASTANPTQTAQATISLTTAQVTASVSPASVALNASQTQQFTATGLGTTQNWSVSPSGVGSISGTGFYTAPSSVATQSNVTITATNASDSTKSASAVVTLNASAQSSQNGPSTITLPIEVVGASGTTASATFNIPSSANPSGLVLWLKIHGLRTETQASVQVNGGSWQAINSAGVTLLGLANNFGGIGGGFHTLTMTMPTTSLQTGSNTVTFKFNGTDGRVSGFRVIGLNVQDASGNSLLPDSTFLWDDPNNWQPPSSSASDIAAGQTLWRTASLITPGPSGTKSIKAHCMDCHAQDGRDLKYFNYSNASIRARSVFHGLTSQQGDQIASYIRSLNVPNPGRPWNPPYQPGPGLDSKPVSDWAAGAGIDAVLDDDADAMPFLTPGGSPANWGATQDLNPHEIPIAIQFPDWNSWLPPVHPLDGLATFANSSCNSAYSNLRNSLQPNSASAYYYALQYFGIFTINCDQKFLSPISINATWTAALSSAVYSTGLWEMVKLWEVNQEFGLEGMANVPFGSKANSRGWYTQQAFDTSPKILNVPIGPGIGNGAKSTWHYIGYTWYHVQLVLNDGQGQLTDRPIDYGYAASSVKDLSWSTGNLPFASLEMLWVIKALQGYTLNGGGPHPKPGTYGFSPPQLSPLNLVDPAFTTVWSATSPSERVQLTTDYVKSWFAQLTSFSVSDYYNGKDGNGRPWASATENPQTGDYGSQFGGQIWFVLPRLRYAGVDPNLTYQITAWAKTLWPAANWALNQSATCNSHGTCTSDK